MKYIEDCYEFGWLTTAGENIDELEKAISEYMSMAADGTRWGDKKATALVNGTAAIHLAVKLAAERVYHSSSGITTPDRKDAGRALYGKRVFASGFLNIKVIGLTGADGGELTRFADVVIKAPETETYMVQELHLPIYHCLCLMLEEYFFGDKPDL